MNATKPRAISKSSHKFSQVPRAEIPRSRFDRSCGLKTTMDAGFLVPIFADEALPGDTFSADVTMFGRLATPIHPFMDNLYIDTFFFAVPIRLVWDNWQRFNGEQRNPGDSTDFLVPTMTAPGGGYASESLHDYLGIPPGKVLTHSSLWHRAYNLIWNEWFRDQNLQNSVVVDVDDGPDDPADYVLLKRGKRHDYFTSCLPWPQKGPSVSLPLGTTAPVTATGFAGPTGEWNDNGVAGTWHASTLMSRAEAAVTGPTGMTWAATNQEPGTPPSPAMAKNDAFRLDVAATGTADLSTASAATINELRQAFQLQKLYERDARGGTRYTEVVRAHFGVVSPDARLQRPEYLGGGSLAVNVNPVAQTSSTDGTSAQGNLSAFGVAAGNAGSFTKSFTEHCVIIGLAVARADLTYQQGLPRMFSRSSRFDFYWPALAHIGEQAVLNKEIWANGDANDDLVFGYQERFAEYRYKPSMITGKFRSDDAASLDVWHLSQDFATLPVLNASFIEENPPISRVVAVTDEPEFLLDTWFRMSCARPMPVYSVPGMIDHF